jgi:hypothetical protein
MKRLIFPLFVLLALVMNTYGQSLRFGLTASPEFTFARILPDNVTSNGLTVGFAYGLLLDLRIDNNERYAFHTGFIHKLTGLNLDVDVKDVNDSILRKDTRNLKIQYIEVPLTIRLRTNEIGYITYWGLFGFTPGINVSARMDQESTDPAFSDIKNEKIGADIGFANLSLTFGGGIEYSVSSSTHLMAGLYYNNGFTNVYSPDDVDDKISLRSLGLRLGVLF